MTENKKKVEKKKNTKTKPKKKNTAPKESYIKRVKKELKLVKWPTRKDVLKYTISTIIFCLALCLLFIFLNFILSVVKGWVA